MLYWLLYIYTITTNFYTNIIIIFNCPLYSFPCVQLTNSDIQLRFFLNSQCTFNIHTIHSNGNSPLRKNVMDVYHRKSITENNLENKILMIPKRSMRENSLDTKINCITCKTKQI